MMHKPWTVCSDEQTYLLGWPKSSFGFFCTILWKNLNELLGQPNTINGSVGMSWKNKQWSYLLVYNKFMENGFLITTKPLSPMPE